jgi:hypothetical protein
MDNTQGGIIYGTRDHVGYMETGCNCSHGETVYSESISYPCKYSTGSSESALAEFRAQKGKQKMSFAIHVKYFDFALIAADTRMSYGENNNLYRDDCGKIIVVPGTNTVITATGPGEFRGNTAKGIISSLKSTELGDIIKEFIESVKPFLYNTNHVLYSLVSTYDKERHTCLTVELSDRRILVQEAFGSVTSAPHMCYQGIDWAREYTDKVRFKDTNDINAAKSELFEHMDNIIRHGETMLENSTVGGNVDMILLRPNKAPEFLTR